MDDIKFNVDDKIEITIKQGGKEFTHHLRQPTIDDIYITEKMTNNTLTVKGDEVITNPSQKDPDIFLWEKIIEKVEGYSFSNSKNWKEKTPVLHKTSIAQLITKADVIDEGDVLDEFGSDCLINVDDDKVIIYLTAWQVGNEILTKHIFRQPSESEFNAQKRIKAMISTSTKRNKIILKPKATTKEWCSLYDDIIVEAHGYIDQENTPETEIAAKVPPVHKIKAITGLFSMLNEEIKTIGKN